MHADACPAVVLSQTDIVLVASAVCIGTRQMAPLADDCVCRILTRFPLFGRSNDVTAIFFM